MPWSAGDARRFTKKARTPAQKRKWARIATGVLKKYHDEGLAIRLANAAMRVKKRRKEIDR